jgi:hypothetical protein
VTLGADYPNTRMIIGWRTYNQLGRVLFQADAFASTGIPTRSAGSPSWMTRTVRRSGKIHLELN